MTDRELSERLSILATIVEEVVNELGYSPALLDVVQELRSLSNQKYTPGAVDWADVKKQAMPDKNRFPF